MKINYSGGRRRAYLCHLKSAGRGCKKRNPAYMSSDGCDHVDIQCGDLINVRKSRRHTRLVRLSDRSFYKKVSEKLGEEV